MIVIIDDGCGCKKKKKEHVKFNFKVGQIKRKKGDTSMALDLTITDTQKVNVTLTPTTESGKPAKLDGAPAWVVTSGNSTVVPASDGLSADLVSEDTTGDTVFSVSADADLGSGTTTITDTITLHVVDEQAKNLGLVAGTPVDK